MKGSMWGAMTAGAIAVMFVAICAWTQAGVAVNAAYAKLLTATDVSKVTGLSGVQSGSPESQ